MKMGEHVRQEERGFGAGFCAECQVLNLQAWACFTSLASLQLSQQPSGCVLNFKLFILGLAPTSSCGRTLTLQTSGNREEQVHLPQGLEWYFGAISAVPQVIILAVSSSLSLFLHLQPEGVSTPYT